MPGCSFRTRGHYKSDLQYVFTLSCAYSCLQSPGGHFDQYKNGNSLYPAAEMFIKNKTSKLETGSRCFPKEQSRHVGSASHADVLSVQDNRDGFRLCSCPSRGGGVGICVIELTGPAGVVLFTSLKQVP